MFEHLVKTHIYDWVAFDEGSKFLNDRRKSAGPPTRPLDLSDAPVESDNGGSNGGGCTVAHRPAVDAPVDADSGSNSNGGSCVVA